MDGAARRSTSHAECPLSRETQPSLENDGYRCLLFTPSRPGGPTLLQSRRGTLIHRHFPDLVTAARQLPHDLVLDGEAVVSSGDRLSFEALQRRASSGGRTGQQLAQAMPAHFIAFDVLQTDGQELLAEPYEQRRAVPESLFTGHALTPPWTLCPMTTDAAVVFLWERGQLADDFLLQVQSSAEASALLGGGVAFRR